MTRTTWPRSPFRVARAPPRGVTPRCDAPSEGPSFRSASARASDRQDRRLVKSKRPAGDLRHHRPHPGDKPACASSHRESERVLARGRARPPVPSDAHGGQLRASTRRRACRRPPRTLCLSSCSRFTVDHTALEVVRGARSIVGGAQPPTGLHLVAVSHLLGLRRLLLVPCHLILPPLLRRGAAGAMAVFDRLGVAGALQS